MRGGSGGCPGGGQGLRLSFEHLQNGGGKGLPKLNKCEQGGKGFKFMGIL